MAYQLITVLKNLSLLPNIFFSYLYLDQVYIMKLFTTKTQQHILIYITQSLAQQPQSLAFCDKEPLSRDVLNYFMIFLMNLDVFFKKIPIARQPTLSYSQYIISLLEILLKIKPYWSILLAFFLKGTVSRPKQYVRFYSSLLTRQDQTRLEDDLHRAWSVWKKFISY